MGFFYGCRVGLLVLIFASVCCAQHYQPEVCLHDAAQRMFPVEAARTMAWMENQKSARIGEITWKVSGDIKGRCEWKIGWKSLKGEEIASAMVVYDEKQLHAGPVFYREVWNQLMKGLSFKPGQSSSTVKELEDAFWSGCARAGMTRTHAAASAQACVNQGSPHSKPQDAAELAGLLSQGAVPILGGACTLDYLMLARAAAWLCHAETMSGATLRREWCVISHLAGREIPASQAWKDAKDAPRHEASCWQWWDMILTNYPAAVKDVCLFATKPGLKEAGLPFVLAYLRFETGVSKSLENVLAELYGVKLLSQPDYAPLLIDWFVMERMRALCFQMAQRNQRDWLELLTLQRQPGADERTCMTADAAGAALAAMDDDDGKDTRIPGLAAAGKVVELGGKAHEGPLRPQAAVSTDDLLVHGWESSLQIWRLLYEFYDYRLGVPDAADALVKAVRASAPSLAPMMLSRNQRLPETGLPLGWLEYFEDGKLGPAVIRQKGRGVPKAGDPGLAIQFLRNCMKRGPLVYDQWFTLFPSNTGEVNSVRLAEMLLKQGSENTLSYGCKFYHIGIPEHVRERFLEQKVTIFEKTLKACPNAVRLQREMLARQMQKTAIPALEAAQKLETHYWLAPSGDHIALIMEKYVEANAPEAAERFYAQALEIDGGSISFSNTEAPMRWALAWFERNEDEMAAADKDASSHSSVDMEKHCLHALCSGDLNRARQTGETFLQRYGVAPQGTGWLLTMLPFLDALKDSSHRQHLEAQSLFLRGGEYPHLQFVILRELEISKVACIRLLALSESRDYAALLITYWQGNPSLFQKTLDSLTPYRRTHMPAMFKIMVGRLKAELLKRPKVTSPDLKPAEETRLDELVRAAMETSGETKDSLR